MSLLEKLKTWMNAEDEAGFPFEAAVYGVRELEPMELVKSAVGSVAANAKKWPDGVDLPDVVEVWLSAQDYEYYGPRRTSCEKRIADAVIAYAEEEGALLERVPTVIMQVDPSLLLGDVRTQARFSNPDEPIVRPATAKRAPEPVRTGPVGGVKTQLFRPNAERAQPAAAAGAATAGGPKAGGATAGGAQAAGVQITQTVGTPAEQKPAGATAGATRAADPQPPACAAQGTTSNNPRSIFGKATADDAAPAPAIALDESDHPYVSQRQALFSCDEGSWSLVSFGRNGTSVQRDGIWTELSTSVPFALRDGDRISFAKSAPLTFSLS